MSDRLIAYNFIADKLGWDSKKSDSELLATKFHNRIPKNLSYTFSLETKGILSRLFSVLKGEYLIKVKDGAVVEFYSSNYLLENKPKVSFVAFDINTNDVIEYYISENNCLNKYDFLTDILLQVNHICSTPDEIPKSFQEDLIDFKEKNNIFIYASKPYGRVVEVKVM